MSHQLFIKLDEISGTINDRLYGIADTGDVPNFIFVTNEIPKEVSASPTKNNAFLFAYSPALLFSLTFSPT